MTAEEYRNYLETDFDDVDLKELKDIRKIRIDRNQTKEKRIAQYLRQVGNPYLVCIGNVKVKIRFANNGVSFEDAFEELSGFRKQLELKKFKLFFLCIMHKEEGEENDKPRVVQSKQKEIM